MAVAPVGDRSKFTELDNYSVISNLSKLLFQIVVLHFLMTIVAVSCCRAERECLVAL